MRVIRRGCSQPISGLPVIRPESTHSNFPRHPTGLWSGRDLECFRGNAFTHYEAVRGAICPFAIEVDPRASTHYATILVPEPYFSHVGNVVMEREKVCGADIQRNRGGSVKLDAINVKVFGVSKEELWG